MVFVKKLAILTFVLLLPLSSWASGDLDAGKAKSATCAACHGADGNSDNPLWPKLAGQNEKYLIKQLKEFKKGKDGGRYDPVMTSLMAALSDQDFEDLAAYFSAQTKTVGVVEKALLKRGETLYRGGNLKLKVAACIACHGPRGLGNVDAGFPALSGQQPDYIVKQLMDYRKETRTNDPSGIMRGIAENLSEEDMKAVASYINGLH